MILRRNGFDLYDGTDLWLVTFEDTDGGRHEYVVAFPDHVDTKSLVVLEQIIDAFQNDNEDRSSKDLFLVDAHWIGGYLITSPGMGGGS